MRTQEIIFRIKNQDDAEKLANLIAELLACDLNFQATYPAPACDNAVRINLRP